LLVSGDAYDAAEVGDAFNWQPTMTQLQQVNGCGLGSSDMVYMSPEARPNSGGSTLNYEKCDVYSLGVCLLSLMTSTSFITPPTSIGIVPTIDTSSLQSSDHYTSELRQLIGSMIRFDIHGAKARPSIHDVVRQLRGNAEPCYLCSHRHHDGSNSPTSSSNNHRTIRGSANAPHHYIIAFIVLLVAFVVFRII
jgi:hypothetical protein